MKKAAIIGYGKSGLGAERLLKSLLYDITVFDDRISGYKNTSEYCGGYDISVITPGINKKKFESYGELSGDIDLAFRFLRPSDSVIAVTGTNGKSTVVWLIYQLLIHSGHNAVACGNFGLSFSDAILDTSGDNRIFVLELSSFQIELIRDSFFNLILLTNLSEDHADRYANLSEYYKAKLRLFNFISSNGTIITETDLLKNNISYNISCNNIINVSNNLTDFPILIENTLDFGNFYLDISHYKLFGKHNLINLSYALLAVEKYIKLDGDITSYITNLEPMPHRMENILIKNNVLWINDSKATNTSSTISALRSFSSNIILLLGGRDKLSDYTVLIDEINLRAKAVVVFGESKGIIFEQIKKDLKVNIYISNHLYDACVSAHHLAQCGDIILLSPSCSSYDEFDNFEHRGNSFKKYVLDITESNK